MRLKTIFFILILQFFSSLALADGYMRLSGMYMSSSYQLEDGSKVDGSRTMYDLSAGVVNDKGWTIGVLYGTEKESSADGTQSMERSGIGPSGGWITTKDSGFYGLLTYFLNPTLGSYKGTGYQLDVGYKFMIRKISFAPQFSKKHFAYDELNGQKISPSYITDRFDPYFVVWVDF